MSLRDNRSSRKLKIMDEDKDDRFVIFEGNRVKKIYIYIYIISLLFTPFLTTRERVSVCRGCIVRRLSRGARACPVCNVATSPPLLQDTRLQRLVYLAVPGLFRSEIERRRHFRMVNPQCPLLAPPLGGLEFTLDDFVSLSLSELEETPEDGTRERVTPEDDDDEDEPARHPEDRNDEERSDEERSRGRSTRYLKCPAGVAVRHLVRLLMLKRGWEEANATANGISRMEIMYQQEDLRRVDRDDMHPLDPTWTLLDIACIFQWKRVSLTISNGTKLTKRSIAPECRIRKVDDSRRTFSLFTRQSISRCSRTIMCISLYVARYIYRTRHFDIFVI